LVGKPRSQKSRYKLQKAVLAQVGKFYQSQRCLK